MKKHKLDKLNILTIKNNEQFQTKIICQKRWDFFNEEEFWTEVFTGQKFSKEDVLKFNISIENFSEYFYDLVDNCKEYKFSKFELLTYYNKLNKLELLNTIEENNIKKM